MARRFPSPSWLQTTNIYEVNIRQYTPEGSFAAFAKELPRLKEMGIETLWFMPVTPISQKERKGTLGSYYACSDYTAINPEFGTLTDFTELLQQAKKMGFRIIIDWVANHTGWDHRWTKEHPDYYKFDSHTGDFQTARGMQDIIELDFANPALRLAMIEAMQYWIDNFQIDGFRCDLASWVELSFWNEARTALDKDHPLLWLGEFDELENPEYGEVFDASYPWTWMHGMKDAYQHGTSAQDLYKFVKKYNGLGDETARAWFTSNHDENSWNGTEYEKYGEMAMPLAVFCATWNGIPLIYSGQEIPLIDQRLKFFDKDLIQWTDKNELSEFYKVLLELRRTNPALHAGDPSVTTYLIPNNQEKSVFAFRRKKDLREIIVILNFSSQDGIEIVWEDEGIQGPYQDVFTGITRFFSKESTVHLSAWQWVIYQR